MAGRARVFVGCLHSSVRGMAALCLLSPSPNNALKLELGDWLNRMTCDNPEAIRYAVPGGPGSEYKHEVGSPCKSAIVSAYMQPGKPDEASSRVAMPITLPDSRSVS